MVDWFVFLLGVILVLFICCFIVLFVLFDVVCWVEWVFCCFGGLLPGWCCFDLVVLWVLNLFDFDVVGL